MRMAGRAEEQAACDKLDVARQAEAALMQAVGQALPRICGCVPDLILPVPAELAWVFCGQVSAVVLPHLHLSCVPLALGTGISRRPPEAEGKADSRDGPQSFNDSTIE